MALLGEMHYIPSGPESWTNLPREGGVAYAAQESWVQNETIKVCHRHPMKRSECPSYDLCLRLHRRTSFLVHCSMRIVIKKVRQCFLLLRDASTNNISLVIYQCGLTRDLSLFEAGDATEVGEKGLTLRYVSTCTVSCNPLSSTHLTIVQRRAKGRSFCP